MFRSLLIATAATGLAAAAHAQDAGPYLEGGYQYFDIKPDGAESGVDTHGIARAPGIVSTISSALKPNWPPASTTVSLTSMSMKTSSISTTTMTAISAM